MPNTENCGRIPRKIPKTWSVEVVVGAQVGPHKRRIIDDSINQLLDWDVIEPSHSRVGYPVVLVK